MRVVYSLLLLVAQVILEVFPISSSGHFRLVELLAASYWNFDQEAALLPPHFDHFLHGPMLLILIVFFRKRWYPFLSRVFCSLHYLRQPVLAGDLPAEETLRLRDAALVWQFFYLIGSIFCADVVTVSMYCLVKFFEKKQIITYSPQCLFLGFFLTFLILLLLRFKRGICALNGPWVTPAELSYKKVLLLGFAQGVALFPGISRFACTFVLGSCLGLPQRTAFEFSFLLAFPLMVGGFLCNGLSGLLKAPPNSPVWLPEFWLVLALFTFIAYWFFAWVYRLALKEQFWYFALYMIIPLSILGWHILVKY